MDLPAIHVWVVIVGRLYYRRSEEHLTGLRDRPELRRVGSNRKGCNSLTAQQNDLGDGHDSVLCACSV